jgi:hypothetical protein
MRPYIFVERQPNSQGRPRGAATPPGEGGGRVRTGRIHAVSSPASSPSLPRRIVSSLERVRISRGTRLLAMACTLACATAVVTHSSSQGHERDVLVESLRRGADRLVGLQGADGGWPAMSGGKPDMTQAGRSGRALLRAWEVTHDPRHYLAARKAGKAVAADLFDGRWSSCGNLEFLAELGQQTGQPAFVEAAQRAWAGHHPADTAAQGAADARELVSRKAPGGWDPGDWRNYLLIRAAEESELGRMLGHSEWADAYVVEAASTWSPKHDHDYWASAAGALLGELERSQDPRSPRLALVQRGLLEANEVADGVSWNDTPYDNYVYLTETAAALAGRARQERFVRTRSATFSGLEFLASRQAPNGGWGAILSLVGDVAEHGDDEVAPAAAAAQESPAADAQAVEALALGLGARS